MIRKSVAAKGFDKHFFLQRLPGSYGRKYGHKVRGRMQPHAVALFDAALSKLGPVDVCLDIGANIGVVTEQLAVTGATIHAIEPDPNNFALLAQRVGHLPNVVLHQIALGAVSCKLRMYRPLDASTNPGDLASQGVTGLFRPWKSDIGDTFDVTQIALDAFIATIGHRASLIKMDIEGAELAILQAMARGEMVVDCDAMFVETHERQYPATWPEVRRMRQKFRRSSEPTVCLYWV